MIKEQKQQRFAEKSSPDGKSPDRNAKLDKQLAALLDYLNTASSLLDDLLQAIPLGRLGRTEHFLGKSPESTVKDSTLDSEIDPQLDSFYLLGRAKRFDDTHNWEQAEALATQILNSCPSHREALMIRARCRRFMGHLSEALDDYRQVCSLEPQDDYAWLGQGAVAIQAASELPNLDARLKLMTEQVCPCYRNAAELSPSDGEIGLSLLELEICIGRYREATGTIGTWWSRLQLPRHTVIGAWLGAIALILAGKPRRKWVKFEDQLQKKSVPLGPLAWVTTEIHNHIKHIEDTGCDREKLQDVHAIHALFLEHFKPNGPLS